MSDYSEIEVILEAVSKARMSLKAIAARPSQASREAEYADADMKFANLEYRIERLQVPTHTVRPEPKPAAKPVSEPEPKPAAKAVSEPEPAPWKPRKAK